jgi:hypothetical protein
MEHLPKGSGHNAPAQHPPAQAQRGSSVDDVSGRKMLQKVLPYKWRIFEIPCYVRRWKKQLLFIGFHHEKVLLLHCFIKYEYGG